MKYVLVSGGVISGIGKGVIASTCGLLLKTQGYKVSSIKIDPYLNIDAGTMSPREHGEVFVLDDGGEVDLDLGNYERYLNVTLTRENNITTGKMYQKVIQRERDGYYLGKTVQMVPHLTDAIQEHMERVSRIPVDDTNEEPDVCIIELGGTVGDLESAAFVHALTQLRRNVGIPNFLQIHVSLVPVINGEMKTKPTQFAIKDARKEGLNPDLIACRCARPLDTDTIRKIAAHCFVEPSQVVSVTDVNSLYHVPLLLESQGLTKAVSEILCLDKVTPSPSLVNRGRQNWNAWKELTLSQDHTYQNVTIALVGKYTQNADSYHSVVKSLEHAAMACSIKLNLIQINADYLEDKTRLESAPDYYHAMGQVHKAEGVLVPGGFGDRGSEGMISAIRICRESKKPFLGICLGMQLATIEFARNVCDLHDAVSDEFIDKGTVAPVSMIVHMPEVDKTTMGATMRLGNRPTIFQPGSEWSKLFKLYSNNSSSAISPVNGAVGNIVADGDMKKPLTNGISNDKSTANGTAIQISPSSPEASPLIINERHRHRYEVNPAYVEKLERAGLSFVGRDESGKRMEILELKDHPWFVGVQFHPEYLSRVLNPSKPFLGLIAASAGMLPEITNGKRRRTSSLLDGVRI